MKRIDSLRVKAVFCDSDGHWLVKFRHTYDPSDMGLQEYRYNEMARKCGICVPDYLNLLALTGYLTQSREAVEEMFRRMVFNYLVDNKDDHCKNFSFMVEKGSDGKWQWCLAPAYDLTRCTEGYNGEHATSVNGTGHPIVDDMVAVGVKNKMTANKCREIYEKMKTALR